MENTEHNNLTRSIKKRFFKMKTRLYLWNNKLHFLIQFQKTPRFFKIIISEKYRKHISIIKYLITAIGLLSSLFIFSSVLYSFLFAIFLFILQSSIESFIFSYKIAYIQPLPDFEIEPKKWLGMSFGYALNPEGTIEIPYVGMLFSDEEYAKKVFNLITSWNYGEHNDPENNINTSILLGENNEYVFFVYPSCERKTIKEFFKTTEEERRKTSLTDVQQRMFVQIIFGKTCKITSSSYLPEFTRRYHQGVPFYFEALIYKGDQPVSVPGLSPLFIHNIKIKKISELTRKDIEYEMLKLKKWDT